MRYVYLFHEGNARMKELLGGKGANLAEMTNIGLPVPCGMTITTDACREYYNNGKKLPEGLVEEVTRNLKAIEEEIHAQIVKGLENGKADADMNAKGQLTAMQRVSLLVDPGTWCPLNSLYNPEKNKTGTTSIVKGLGRVNGKWCVIIASDNKKHAGTWVPGQADNLLRGSDTAKRLRIPLIYLLECAGVELDKQEKVYPNRRGGGTPFYRNSELNQMGIPVIVGIHGTNPAGGGYHSISPTVLVAHEKANMAVGGAGIVGGMNPKPHVDMEAALAQIEATKGLRADPPGSVSVHYGVTGFFREVYTEQEGVIAGIKKYVDMLPTYDLEFFRVDAPQSPAVSDEELYDLVLNNKNRPYDMYSVIARLFDGSQFMEYKKGYGPEMITGIAKVDGLLVGVVANQQGVFPNYPEYKMEKYGQSMGAGGKLYRQGLIKMNEFVTLCARDRIPLIWLQDTTGIDVGDDAEKAELLGLGQSLIYSIQNSKLPSLEVTLRKASAAAHYVLGGPQGNDTNVFSLATGASEYYVMPGETAANAMYSRKLVKAKKAGEPLQPIIDKMNAMIQMYTDKSRPKYCTKQGMVDEIVDLTDLRPYIQAFTEAAYQNPQSICPMHQMLAPRSTREFINYGK